MRASTSRSQCSGSTPLRRAVPSKVWKAGAFSPPPSENRKAIYLHAGHAASRISSTLKGSTKQFGWLQAHATKISFLSTTSASPATIRICEFRR